jgi:hypothetical protein
VYGLLTRFFALQSTGFALTMALINARQCGFKQAAAPAVRRTRVVKIAAVQKQTNVGSAVAAAAAALLLIGGPALAVPLADVAGIIPTPKQAIDKTLNKLDSLDPPKGVAGPEVSGQYRASPEKGRQLAAENSPAGSPEAEAKASRGTGRRF